MNILDQSIEAAGGVTALARSLNLEPNVISNWRARGIPDGWAAALAVMRKHGDGVFSHVTNVIDQDTSIGTPGHITRCSFVHEE